MTTPLLAQLRAVAMTAAEAGGRAALAHFRRADLEVETKADESPVTRADRDAEATVKAVIAEAFPDDGWLGEETGTHGGTTGRVWICDPIDGTKNFVRGIPLWATLIACEQEGRVVASAVAIPGQGELYDAALGAGARCNGVPIRASKVARLEESLFCFETPRWFQKYGMKATYDSLCERSLLQRGFGDAYAHMLVASGRAEVIVEPILAVWDVAATSLIVNEAGGRFSDLHGRDSIRSNHALVTNGCLHDKVLEILSQTMLQRPDEGHA